MRFVLAILLVAHGVAHLVGVVSSWKLAVLPELPYKTVVLSGRVDVGDAGIRVMGVLWLLAALAFWSLRLPWRLKRAGPCDSPVRRLSHPSSCASLAGPTRASAWLSM